MHIVQQEKTYNECCIMKGLLPMIDAALLRQKKVNGLSGYLSSYQRNGEEIRQQEEVLNNTHMLKLMKPLVDKACDIRIFIDQLETKTAMCGCLITEEFHAKESKNLYCNYKTELNNLIVHCQLLYDYNSRMIPKMDQITGLDNQQSLTAHNIATIKRDIKNIKQDMKTVQDEKNSFILSHGICPCCGQKVDESHVSAITTFMEGQ
jgi:DNA repair exonuclease SbcCD ATPase subunit